MKANRALTFLLAAISFTHILDFVILMPLGPMMMRVFHIGATEFSWVVSSYTFSAGLFGFLGAFLLDRFDRRHAMGVLYSGFLLGTFACALAISPAMLIGGRIIAGGFGGMLAALIFSVIADAYPEAQRGRAMGIVMSSFSVASVVGVPLGLWGATHWGWHVPFWSIGGLGCVLLVAIWKLMPPMTKHITQNPADRMSPLGLIVRTLRTPNQLWAILLNFMLVFSGFSLIPYISAYLVSNVGMPEKHLSLVYLCGGALTFFTSPLIGRLADRFGKQWVFVAVSLCALIPILVVPYMPRWPLALILFFTTLFFVFVSGRFVPAMAMITSSVAPAHRGSFMSIATAIQQIGSGLGASVAGLIIVLGPNGELGHYHWVGALSALVTLGSLWVAFRIKPVDSEQ